MKLNLSNIVTQTDLENRLEATMCYTVQQWTKVCPNNHCVDLQICWRQCRATRNITVGSTRKRDFYTLCSDLEPTRMLPMIISPNVSPLACDVCKAVGFAGSSVWPKIEAEDNDIHMLWGLLREDKLRLGAVISRKAMVEDAMRKRQRYLQVCRRSWTQDDEFSDLSDTVKNYNDEITNLQNSIRTREDVAQGRTNQFIHDHNERLIQPKVEEFNRTTEWRWRTYSLPRDLETTTMGAKCPEARTLPRTAFLDQFGVARDGSCDWNQTRLHRLPAEPR